MRPLKVLLSAYACEPEKGSEPAVGWNWALRMAQRHEVWVMTRANNRPLIEAALSKNPPERLHWVYVDLPGWMGFWKKGLRGVHLYYYLWQLAAWRQAAHLHRQVGLDLVHHVTFGKYWVPAWPGFLPVKSIIGPVGGGESTPPALISSFSRQGQWYERKRDWARTLADCDPVLRALLRRASLVAATTPQSAERIQRLGARRVVVEPQFGLSEEEFDFFGRLPLRSSRPFRLISMGRLLHWKGYHLGLQAFARFHRRCPESEYWLVSSGPEAAALQQLAAELGVASHVKFWGRLPKLSDVYDKLAQCDVLVHPATHEAFGNVCLEALASGRPVICLDVGGPALQVSPECGFRAPVDSLETTLDSMANAMARLYEDPELLLRMSGAARRRARTEFDWARKAERMDGFYRQVCGAQ